MELFAKVMEYQNNCTPGENLKNLSAELERKKSFRKSSIRQLTLGVEAKEQPQPYTEQFFALDALLADSGRKIPSEFSNLPERIILLQLYISTATLWASVLSVSIKSNSCILILRQSIQPF